MELRLETARLTLVALTAEFIRALSSRRVAEALIGAALPDGWPDEELASLLPLYAGWMAKDPGVLGFGPWAVVHRGELLVVGSAGFLGLPTPDGSVELGFGMHPDHRRRGYASEAAQALVEWSLDQTAVDRVFASCEPDNRPSMRVLEKVGMTRISEDGAIVTWELARTRRGGDAS